VLLLLLLLVLAALAGAGANGLVSLQTLLLPSLLPAQLWLLPLLLQSQRRQSHAAARLRVVAVQGLLQQ
jgi:hypothetical protein